MVTRRELLLASAATSATGLYPLNAFAQAIYPKTFRWIGSAGTTMYWDDPNNWEGGEYPNQKDAIAVFSNSLSQDTKILLRSDVTLAQLWLSEKHAITFDAENVDSSIVDAPKITLSTSTQLSRLYVDHRYPVDHRFGHIIINHSCVWHGGIGSNYTPLPSDQRATIHYGGRIGNYKDAKEATLLVDGNLAVELSSENTFVGSVIAKNNGQVHANVNGAIPDGTPIEIDTGGELFLREEVVVNASLLKLNGETLKEGLYSGMDSSNKSTKKLHSLTGQGTVLVKY